MASVKDKQNRPVVVVTGMGMVTSLGAGKADNWQHLTAGLSGVRAISRFPTEGLKTRVAGTVDFVPVDEMSTPALSERLADLAASGNEQLQPENLKASPMRSWIGLYALLKMMRDVKMTEFTGAGITKMLHDAKDVPMLDIFGGENWTPNMDHPGMYKRAGTNHWATYKWDPEAANPAGEKGNFVELSKVNFDEVLCGSPLGGPC